VKAPAGCSPGDSSRAWGRRKRRTTGTASKGNKGLRVSFRRDGWHLRIQILRRDQVIAKLFQRALSEIHVAGFAGLSPPAKSFGDTLSPGRPFWRSAATCELIVHPAAPASAFGYPERTWWSHWRRQRVGRPLANIASPREEPWRQQRFEMSHARMT
jgi:hypothetical protein